MRKALWKDRTLVKTWAMRGTLHLLPSSELPSWHAALRTSPRYLRESAWQQYFGLSLNDLERLTEAVGAALEGQVLTRDELVREMQRTAGSDDFAAKIAVSSWGTILKPAAFTGRLCFGPSVGQRVRFTHPNTWLQADSPRIDPEIAIPEITRRYLAAYGPATYRDLARWWGGGGTATAKQWIAALGDEVARVEIEGAPAWVLARDLRKLRDVPPLRSVRLLPAFDQYVVSASCHAEQLLPHGISRGLVYRPQGWISPVLLVNGRMHGTWRHEIKGSTAEIVIEPFLKIPQWARRAAKEEAERLATFLGCKMKLSWKG